MFEQSTAAAPLLHIEALSVAYGSIGVLNDITLEVGAGEIVALIGANGAGKTTLLRTVSGLMRPRGGRITFAQHAIEGKAAHLLVRQGLSHVPEGRRIFTRMTVRENLLLGAYVTHSRRKQEEELARVLVRFPRLEERLLQRAGTLSGGEQQMLAIARALMARPRLLLLDEPSLGLAPLMVEAVFALIREIHKAGTTVLLVEQNATAALEIASRGYVLELGRIVRHGRAEELVKDAVIRNAYLGGE